MPNLESLSYSFPKQPITRNLTLVEAQSPLQRPELIIIAGGNQKHFQRVENLQQQWDEALGITTDRNKGRLLSYNPVLDRANFERLIEEEATPEQVEAFKRDLILEKETNLRERLNAAQSTVTYFLDDDGKSYPQEDFGGEDVDTMFLRGAQYRVAKGSPEPERELKTVEGGIKAKQRLAKSKSPLNAIVVSPPGISYQDNFVDIYKSGVDPLSGRRIITMTRYVSSFNEGQYREVLNRLQPGYFQDQEGGFDVWCLDNPLFIIDPRDSHEIFNENFKSRKEATGEKEMQAVLTQSRSLIEHYRDVICGKFFQPKEVAKAFNAVLNKADAIKEWISNKLRNGVGAVVDFMKSLGRKFKNAKDESEWFGKLTVKTILAACGISEGFSIKGGIKFFALSALMGMARSLGALDKDNMEGLYYLCPSCGAVNRREQGKTDTACGSERCKSGSVGCAPSYKEDSVELPLAA